MFRPWFALLRRFSQSYRACRAPARPRKPRETRLRIEDLETRLTPSCSAYWLSWHEEVKTIACQGNTNDIVTVDEDAVSLNVFANNQLFHLPRSSTTRLNIETDGGNDQIRVLRTTPGVETEIYAGNDNDLVQISPFAKNLSNIRGDLYLNPGSGSDTLEVYDSLNSGGASLTLTGNTLTRAGMGEITYAAGFTDMQLYLGAGAPTLNVADSNYYPTMIHTGTSGASVNVQGTTGPLTIAGQGGHDTIRLGSDNTTQDILKDVTITNSGGGDFDLTVNDSADISHRTATLNPGSLVGLNPFSPHGITWDAARIRSLEVRGGTAGNTFYVEGTPYQHPSIGAIALYSGTGADTVYVRADQGGLNVYGQNGNDTVIVGNQGSLSGITKRVYVTNVTGYTALTVDGSAGMADQTVTLDANRLSGLATGNIDWATAALNGLYVYLGGGDDTFVMNGSPYLGAGRVVTVDGGGGSNSFVAGAYSDFTWTITAEDYGYVGGPSLGSNVHFVSFGNLTGGTYTDTFIFGTNGYLTGWLDGGDGAHNKLDFGQYRTDVYVNFQTYETGDAVGHRAFFFNIQDAETGVGNDILVGDDQSNVLIGGPGNDILIAGGSGYSFNPDTLQGGAGEDILIAGFTIYDTDADSLLWLRDQWAGPGTYQERVDALSPYLNADTVYSNWAVGSVLTGGSPESDWYFLRLFADGHDGTGDEVIVPLVN